MTVLATLVFLVNNVLGAYLFVLIARVVLSWLIGFGVLNGANGLVSGVHEIAAAVVDPALAKMKKVLPFLVVGPLDLSPVALYFLIQALQIVLIGLVL